MDSSLPATPIIRVSDLCKTFRHLNQKRGTTIILTTRDISDIERLCQRVIIIDKGHLLYDGTLAEIKRRYGHLRSARFINRGWSDDG